MKARIASILLVAACLFTPALAQDKPGTLPDMPSQAQLDAAVDLLQANHSISNMGTMLDVMEPQEKAELRREHPTATDETINNIVKIVRGAIDSHTDDLTRIYAIAYARHFSIEEMHALAAFYRSEPGQKYLQEIPALLKEVTPVGISYLKGVIAQEVQRAVEKMRSQGVKI
jgi:hypothetical protein